MNIYVYKFAVVKILDSLVYVSPEGLAITIFIKVTACCAFRQRCSRTKMATEENCQHQCWILCENLVALKWNDVNYQLEGIASKMILHDF